MISPSNKLLVLASTSFAGATYIKHALEIYPTVIGLSRSAEKNSSLLAHHQSTHLHNYQFHQLDINQDYEEIIDLINKLRPEIIVDFAGQGMVAESWHSPHEWYLTNIVSKSKIQHYLSQQKWLKKYIKISTPEVYGSNSCLIEEKHPYNPSTPYAISHAAIDMNTLAYQKQYGFPAVIGRFANFYGPHQQLYRIIPKTILSILKRERLPLHGGGESLRAFIYSSDFCSAIDCLISKGRVGEVYHFSPTEFLKIKDVVGIICHQLNVEFADSVEITKDRAGKDLAYFMNSSKSINELHWNNITTINEGIKETIDWIKTNLLELQKQPDIYIHKA